MKAIQKQFKLQWFIWSAVLLLSMGGGMYYQVDTVQAETTVYITRTGSKYHTHKCGNGTYYPTTLSDAKSRGLTPCSKCYGGGSSYSSSSGSSSSGNTGSSRTKPVKINKTSIVLLTGQNFQLKLYNATGRVAWSSSNRSVASVTSSGKVTAKKKGKAVITAKAGTQRKNCVVTVEKAKLSKQNVSLEMGKTAALKLSGCKHSIKWSSSDSEVVKVNKGKLTARSAGTATVTAQAHNRKFSCKVTVAKMAVQQITLEQTSVQMGYQKEVNLKVSTIPAKAIDYYDILVTSSNEEIVSASEDYYPENTILLESREQSGTAVISVSVGGAAAQCQVEVVPSVIQSLTLSDSNLLLKPEETTDIYFAVEPYDATNYCIPVWTSGDGSVVTVEGETGYYANIQRARLTAVGEGEADITVTLGNRTATCHVVVARPEILDLTLSDTELILEPGEVTSIYFTVEPYEAMDYYTPVWNSKDESVVTVEGETGHYADSRYAQVTAVGEGETDITITLGSRTVTCHVVVEGN